MGYREFIYEIQKGMKEKLGPGVKVERRRVVKNNGVILEGISLREEGSKISPMIYLESYYEIYQQGVPIEELIEDVLRLYSASIKHAPRGADFYTSFERVAPRIVSRLINFEKNREQLEKVPYIPCLDLAQVFYYVMEEEEMKNGSILIHNEHLNIWGITAEQLCEVARKNTLLLYPSDFMNIHELLKAELTGLEGQEKLALLDENCLDGEQIPMYVLTNRERRFGAVNLIYDKVLSDIADQLEDDFYVLPSSVHECIIVPADVDMSRGELRDMVIEINRTQVLPEEVLSDQVYLYQREKHKLCL